MSCIQRKSFELKGIGSNLFPQNNRSPSLSSDTLWTLVSLSADLSHRPCVSFDLKSTPSKSISISMNHPSMLILRAQCLPDDPTGLYKLNHPLDINTVCVYYFPFVCEVWLDVVQFRSMSRFFFHTLDFNRTQWSAEAK